MERSARPRLSVVVPMYNETHRMGDSLPKLLDYLSRQSYTYEIVAVDDGSTDGTADMARELLAPVSTSRVLEERPNRGKGHAVKVGMLAAKGDYALFLDADMSTPPSEVEKFWPWLEQGYDVVIGSRKMPGAQITRHQPAWRENLGKVFTWLTNRIVTKGISDITCGFKCFSREAAQEVFSRSVVSDWSFDAEILFITQRLGYKIKEVPVTWHDETGTKVRLLRDAPRAIAGLLRIRRNALRGAYK